MKILIFFLFSTLFLNANAQDSYEMVKDRLQTGLLTINGNQFSVETVNERANTCSYSGTINHNTAEDGNGCLIHFSFTKNSVSLNIPDAAMEACNQYCGLSASLNATTYRKSLALCTDKGTAIMEKRFQAAYQSKHYHKAAEIKQRYLNECDQFLYLTNWMRTLNDLAVSYKHANYHAACRKTLLPMAEWLSYTPNYINQEDFTREASAAQLNWKQCNGQGKLSDN